MATLSALELEDAIVFQSAARMWSPLMSSNPTGRMIVADLTQDQRTGVQEVVAGVPGVRSSGGPPPF